MASSESDRSYVIVAIPEDGDRVWNVSSEKIPHLTLLYLGDNLENEERVEEFLEHFARTSATRFSLDVDRRGVLGEHSADVLFFGDRYLKEVKNLRTQLLLQPDIFKAYHSTEQYPSWIPHLTMGYPETPAKKTEWGPEKFYSVTFDRLSLWVGDSVGAEFKLKDYHTDMSESLHTAMSRGEEFLSHYGVKGMKWGVVRDNLRSPGTIKALTDLSKTGVRNRTQAKEYLKVSEDHTKADSLRVKTRVAGVKTLSNRDLQQLITRMNLEQQFANLKQVEHDRSLVGKGKRWAGNFVNDVLKDAASSWLKRPGSNFSGRTSYRWGEATASSATALGQTVMRKAIGS